MYSVVRRYIFLYYYKIIPCLFIIYTIGIIYTDIIIIIINKFIDYGVYEHIRNTKITCLKIK